MTIQDLLSAFKEFFINTFQIFLYDLTYVVFYPLNVLVSKAFPNYDSVIVNIQSGFETIRQMVTFALDMTFISRISFAYLIGSLLFRVSISITVWSTKILVKWWHYLVP